MGSVGASGISPLPPPQPPPRPNTEELDTPLHAIGFQIEVLSPTEVNGYLRVNDSCCESTKMLHRGIPAMIAEALASMGAHVASGFGRVAGVQLSVNHHRSAAAGDLVFACGTPVEATEGIQVWEVRLWKMNESNMKKEALISSSRAIILSNMKVPEHAKDSVLAFRKYAKL